MRRRRRKEALFFQTESKLREILQHRAIGRIDLLIIAIVILSVILRIVYPLRQKFQHLLRLFRSIVKLSKRLRRVRADVGQHVINHRSTRMFHVRDVVFNVSNFHPLSIERLRHLRRFHLLFRRFVLILLLRLLVIPSGAVERGRSRHVERGSRRISPAVRVHPPAFRQRFSHRRRRFGIVGRALRSSRSRAVHRLVSSNVIHLFRLELLLLD